MSAYYYVLLRYYLLLTRYFYYYKSLEKKLKQYLHHPVPIPYLLFKLYLVYFMQLSSPYCILCNVNIKKRFSLPFLGISLNTRQFQTKNPLVPKLPVTIQIFVP